MSYSAEDKNAASYNLESIIRLKAEVDLQISKGEKYFWIVDADHKAGQVMVSADDLYAFLKIQAQIASEIYVTLITK